MYGRWLRTCAPALLLLVLAIATPAATEVRVVEPDQPDALPSFALEDHTGKTFSEDSLRGSWHLILLGFTHCPDVCPFVLSNLAEVRSELGLRVRPDNLPRVVFVAIDPQRDRPLLAEYVGYFDPEFLGVTGSREQLDIFVQGVDGFARLGKPDANGDYEVQHSASVIVTGPDGRIHAKLSPPLDPGAVAEYLARKQIAYRRDHPQSTQ